MKEFKDDKLNLTQLFPGTGNLCPGSLVVRAFILGMDRRITTETFPPKIFEQCTDP